MTVIRWWWLLVAASLCASCTSATQLSNAAGEQEVREEVLGRSRALFDAEHRGDRAALEELLDDDYRYLSSIGNRERPKKDEIELQTGVLVETYSIEKAHVVQLDADAVVLHYFAHQQLRRKGETSAICPYSGAVEAWRRRHGTWRLAARTEWLVGSQHAPPCLAPGGVVVPKP